MRTPPRILIVDDNPMNLEILQTRLAVHGYEIVTAADGEEALTIASETLNLSFFSATRGSTAVTTALTTSLNE